ncbi:conserved hypothetical protein [Verrucomicrobia bacterium]|nr:conserved hypothetical protein [Verrucomicrobiota bacterium]
MTGNGGTTAGANFLGTTDNQPLELAVNHARALRLEPNTNGAPNVIGGASVNLVQPGVVGATIAGGGAANYENFSFTNSVSADLGSIGGGGGNAIETNAPYSTIGGGAQNTIRAAAWYSTIGGGKRNTIQTNAYQSTIGGGFVNTIEAGAGESTISGGNNNLIDSNALVSTIGGGADNFIRAAAQEATIGGGNRNLIQTSAAASTIAGGDGNTIWSGAAFATIGGGLNNVVTGGAGTIPGGSNNFAGGNSSFAAGNRAKARDDGAFVWAGGNTIDYGSGMPNRFHVYALNGLVVDYDVQRSDGGGSRWILVGAETQFPGEAIATSTGAYLSSGGQWVNSSDRNVKADFHAITPRKVLAKVARLSVQTWRYTNEVATVRHLGPMAQDFHAAFGLGDSDKTIGTVDETGVALAAIQGLNEKLDEEVKAKEQEINELELRNNALERRLSALESLVGSAPAR